MAKLTGEGNYSIISDYLGTPAEAYDADGKCVWSAELDIYGRVGEHTGDVDFIPFLFFVEGYDVFVPENNDKDYKRVYVVKK